MTESKRDWFIRESLGLKYVLNIARGAAPRDAVPASGEWRIRYDALVAAVREGRLYATSDDRRRRFWLVALNDLWSFASHADEHWKWARSFCRDWADARGQELKKAGTPRRRDKGSRTTATVEVKRAKSRALRIGELKHD
jgi:hypothetical protein